MTRLLALATAFVVPENRRVFRALAEECGYDVTIVSPRSWLQPRYGCDLSVTAEAEEDANYRVIPLEYVSGRFDHYRSLQKVIRATNPQVVVCGQEFNAFSTISALFLARLLVSNPLTISCSLQNIPFTAHRLRERVRQIASFAASDIILASCNDAAQVLQAQGYRGVIHVMYPLGSAPRSQSGQQPKDPNAPLTIGFVGRISVEKGVFDLVDAVARMRPRPQLLFVGDGPDRLRLESRLAECNLTSASRFTGFVSRADTASTYHQMDLVVVPSRTTSRWKEQFGVVIAEAMAAGVPVVGSSSGAIPEVVGDAGLVFPEGDVESLAAYLTRLCATPALRKELSNRSLSRSQTLYTPQAMARQLNHLISRLRVP